MLDRRAFVLSAAALSLPGVLRAAAPAPAARPLPAMLAPAAMAADLALIGRAYGRLHPGLGRYLPPGGFDRLVGEAQAWAARERSPGDFYLMLSRLTAAVRCGHSHANPANQRRAVQQELLGRADRMPFCAVWLGSRLVVSDGLASGLAAGTEILSIDGTSVTRMQAAMLPLTRADGSNDAKRVAQLGLHRGDRFAAFDLFRPLLFPATAGVSRLSLRRPGRSAETVELATAAEGSRGTAAAADPQYGWRFSIGADGIGLLTMPDWSLYNSKWDWRAFLDRCADAMIQARGRGLIVDLRENEGGMDCGDHLLARLIERPVARLAYRRLVRFRETPAELRPQLDTWDPSFHSLGREALGPDEQGFYALDEGAGETIDPRGARFASKVAVLVSATCSSATFGFAELVRRASAAILVGTPTGGNLRGINGGAYFFLRLPETGFEVDLPLIGYFPTTPQPDAGIVPDVVVHQTLEDLAEGRDLALERAAQLIAA